MSLEQKSGTDDRNKILTPTHHKVPIIANRTARVGYRLII